MSYVIVLILWAIVGIGDVIMCVNKEKCTWLSFWCVYAVLIIDIIDRILN